MNFLDNIKDETILIVPNTLKSKILEYIDKLDHLVNVKLYGLNEVRDHLHFSYKEEAILYLMDKFGYKYEVSSTLIKNMYFTENIIYIFFYLNFIKTLATKTNV